MKPITTLLILLLSMNPDPILAEDSGWDQITETYDGNMEITVYRDPGCGCCSAWIKHLERHHFRVIDIKSGEMAAIKQRYKVPDDLSSCHTAVIDGYVFEGHVPADDIKRVLKERPEITGLAVPGMPTGTPGMEQGGRKDPFAVIQFDESGNPDTFHEYWAY